MRKNAGMSLIEVVIASIILVAVFGMSFMILHSASDTAERASLLSELENNGRAFAEDMKILFREGWYNSSVSVNVAGTNIPLGLYPNTPASGTDAGTNNTEVIFQIPVGRDNTGKLVFGYTDAIGMDESLRGDGYPLGAGGACILRFEADEVFRESSGATAAPTSLATILPTAGFGAVVNPLPVTITSRDLNSDNDTLDTFVRGKIKKFIVRDVDGDGVAAITTSSVLVRNVMLRVNPADTTLLNADMEAPLTTGTAIDPLFQMWDINSAPVLNVNMAANAKSMVVTVFTGTWDSLFKKFLMRANRETVYFRNPQ